VEAIVIEAGATSRVRVHMQASALEALSRRRRFEGLLERHQARLRRVVYGMVRDPHRVDDVLQDAFVKVYRSLPKRFESAEHEAAWLYRVVYRTCLNDLRANKRRLETPGIPDDLPASSTVSEDSMAVATALSRLHVDARAVLILVDVVGLDYDTTSAVLRVPRGTVASRLHSARGLLRDALGGQDA
jgi:RNA polymerase sigma factor (sigma-70 family)